MKAKIICGKKQKLIALHSMNHFIITKQQKRNSIMKKVKIESRNSSNLLSLVAASKAGMKKTKKESTSPSNLLAVVCISK